MQKRLLFCLTCVFLFTSFSVRLTAQNTVVMPGTAVVMPGTAAVMPGTDRASQALAAALLERDLWNASGADQAALLVRKAEALAQAGDWSRACETLDRVPSFGLSADMRQSLTYKRLAYLYHAGRIEEFLGMLDEALVLEELDADDAAKISAYLESAKPRHRSEDAAMLLSILPGVGHAYSGDWRGAAGHFLAEGAALALGIGALTQGLYIAAIAGTGMLLHPVLTKGAANAMRAARDFNDRAARDYYAPVVEVLER